MGCDLKCFHSQETKILKQEIISCPIFWLTTKAPSMDFFRLNMPRGSKTTFSTPKMYDKHPWPFYMGVPLGFKPLLGIQNLKKMKWNSFSCSQMMTIPKSAINMK